ncbi:hypothetical protein [Melittangium boletus]|uniref:Lipoprotein n=1 Tax=Melittangium boletus DSM 14713 TaxID=1294270 RepID=A0A250IA27_9BACT|nr:hypothetical protein [Melittangium boletus]ATB28719.1 hypothetical protein MEBOL_002168 [Melittangium boletus DSM 14713]
MPWRTRGLLGAVALVGLTACGVSQDEAVRLKEGVTLGDPARGGLQSCTTFGCTYADEACLQVFFEYGRSPALCLTLDVCERLECEQEGQRCAIFDGFPGQVKCIEPRD